MEEYSENAPKSFPGVDRLVDRFRNTGLVMPEDQRKIYRIIADQYQGKSIVDIGIGAGVGSNILSHRAMGVWGIDIEQELVDFARAMFSSPRLTFDQYDLLNPPTRPHTTFDVVLLLEVIEHLPRDQWDLALNNLKKFFKETTVGFISTPNRNSPTLGHDHPTNELHCYEATAGELYELLIKHFGAVVLYSVPKLTSLAIAETVDGTTPDTPILAKIERPISA